MSVQNYRERTTQTQESQLLTFNSEFRQLRYGDKKPLNTTNLPKADEDPFSPPAGDFLLRGGVLQPLRSTTDAVRLTNYFASVEGLLFTAKQNTLAQGPAISKAVGNFLKGQGLEIKPNREGVYVPTSTILAASLGANNGIHLNKQGLNPFSLTDGDGGRSAAQGNQDGGILLSILNNLGGGRPFYLGENIVGGADGNENALYRRLQSEVGEFDENGLFVPPSSRDFRGLRQNERVESFNSSRKVDINVFGYATSPSGAFTAFGNSNYSSSRANRAEYNALINDDGFFIRNANEYNGRELLSASRAVDLSFTRKPVVDGATSTFLENLASEPVKTDYQQEINETQESGFITDNFLSKRDREGIDQLTQVHGAGQRGDFERLKLDFRRVNDSNFKGVDYNEHNIEDRVGFDSIKSPNVADISDYQAGKMVGGSRTVADKVTFSPIYRSGLGPDSSRVKTEVNDLVKFRIAAVDADNPSNSFYMHFRSYIDSFQDNYSSQWDAQRFMGRGENFYKYQGFDRDIAMSFTVAAQSKPELMRMYHKLNYLASNLMPDFTTAGYMSGPLVRLTVGGYLYEQYGFIQSLNYQIPQESPWEIAIPSSGVDENNNTIPFSDPTVKEMPHIIQITGFQFKPIHNFVPKKQQLGVTSGNGVGRFGRERYIALSNGFAHADGYKETNYNG